MMRFSLVVVLSILPWMTGIAGAQESSDQREASVSMKMGKSLMKLIAKETSDDGLQKLAQSPAFLKGLFRWKILDGVDFATLSSLNKTPFMKSFLNDMAWQEGFLGSGPLPNMGEALSNLAILCKKDAKAMTTPLYKKLATATALEFARNEPEKKLSEKKDWTLEMMMDRYSYFRSSHVAGLLNPMFDQLDYWDMRVLGGCKVDSWGRSESLAWQRDNVCLPAQAYTGACWQASYRSFNAWGASIHGRDYYTPFDPVFKGVKSQMVKEIGGVCGSLSHFGAFSAIANGIPATTMGEPGHCAYTVRIDPNTWQPGYSLKWQRGCHWCFYGHQWSQLLLTQETFANKKDFSLAMRLSWMAQLADKSEDKEKGRELYQEALKVQPKNFPIWMEYLDREIADGSLTAEQWAKVSSKIMNAYSKDYPEMASLLLNTKVYPVLMEKLTSLKSKSAEIIKFHKNLDKMIPLTWDFPATLDAQEQFLGGGTDATVAMIDIVTGVHMQSNDYGSPSLSWAMKKVGDSLELRNYLLSKIVGAKGAVNDKAILALASEMMKKAEASNDMQTFQDAGKLIVNHLSPSLPAFEPFPGDLLSSGGLLTLSSVSGRYGEPWKHWGVIEKCGGNFHTDEDNPGLATVMMPRIGDLSGIVVVGTNGNSDRLNGIIIETSLDGNSWTKVGEIPKMERVHRIDLKGKKIRAQFVRLTRPGKNFFHLDGILVYGKKAS
ncbi:MAG: hypothetical protein RR373_04260 [Akkermansia sp.]